MLLWQLLQSMDDPFNNCASGMWFPGLAIAPPLLPCEVYVPLWHDLQVPVLTTEWFMVTDVLKLT